MSTITASDVNKLRQTTGAGMMDCKKALMETNGDFDAAIDYLRKKGQKVSEKRADRETNEGVVIARTTDDNKVGVIVNLGCETDFVAKNEDFINLAQDITKVALDNQPATKDELLQLSLNGSTINEVVLDNVAKIGEKVEIANYDILKAESVIPYIHANYRVGVLVALNQDSNEAIQQAGKDVAMQIAAMKPVAVDKDAVSEEIINRELEIGREQARNEGKPEEMIDRIAEGKLNKFYKENTLLNQQYVKDSSKTVGQMLKEVDSDLQVKAFTRVSVTD